MAIEDQLLILESIGLHLEDHGFQFKIEKKSVVSLCLFVWIKHFINDKNDDEAVITMAVLGFNIVNNEIYNCFKTDRFIPVANLADPNSFNKVLEICQSVQERLKESYNNRHN